MFIKLLYVRSSPEYIIYNDHRLHLKKVIFMQRD